ncbi:MAG: FkbM family methyltransferase [Pseudomonadota bacterium]
MPPKSRPYALPIKLAAFVTSFLQACAAVGFLGAIKAKFLYRLAGDQRWTATLRRTGKPFTFRPRGDIGALSHFFMPNYHIEDTANLRIGVIIDGGANIGAESVRFAHYFPQAKIISIELQRENHEVLVENTKHFPNVTPLHAALYATEQTLGVTRDSGGGKNANEGFHVTTEPASETIQATTLDRLVEKHGLESIDILKLDIEGAEYVLFEPMDLRWLKLVKCLIFECPDADRPYTTELIYAALARTGHKYRTRISGENIVLFREDVNWTLHVEPVF